MKSRKLTEQLRRVAVDELNEDPAKVAGHLNEMRQWIQSHEYIVSRTEDQFLLAFLRGTKYNIEKTKSKLEQFYSTRTSLPELFKNRDPSSPGMQKLLNLGIVLPLPEVNDKGERLILLRMGGQDIIKLATEELFQYFTLIVDILLNEDDNFIIAGVHVIIDMEGVTMAHFMQFTRHPNLSRKLVSLFLTSTPCRPKGLYYINASTIFTLFQAFLKPFLPEKIKRRIFAIYDSNLQAEGVPIKLLPNEYGGATGSINDITENWKQKVAAYRSWYFEDQKYGTDNSKRKKKSHSFLGYF